MSNKERLEKERDRINREIRVLEDKEYAAKIERNRVALGLKPCPFCGSKNVQRSGGMEGSHDPYSYSVIVCLDCRGSGGHHGDTNTAIAHWNKRKAAE